MVLLLGRGGGVTRLLLCGVVLASACGALITVMLTLADYGQLRGMVFWLAGDLSWAQRPGLELLAAAIGLLAACRRRPLAQRARRRRSCAAPRSGLPADGARDWWCSSSARR